MLVGTNPQLLAYVMAPKFEGNENNHITSDSEYKYLSLKSFTCFFHRISLLFFNLKF